MMGMHGVAETLFFCQLKEVLVGRVCLLGVGNRLRRDDGVGSLLAERLDGTTAVPAIDAGDVPENYLEKVVQARPDTVVILDAADFGGSPGDWQILDLGDSSISGLSTHGLSLQITAGFLKARTQARIALLAVQPADTGLGTRLSEEISQAIERLQEILSAALQEHMNEEHARSCPSAHR